VLEGLSYCETSAGILSCGMEGDAGSFTVSPAKGGAVIVTVGSYGLALEGAGGFVTLEARRGDDRSFILPQVARCK
jgi:hypothetical protein